MSLNKNALIRYKTIDKCLQNKYRKWTLNDLIETCSDVLYEYEGKETNVSKRTIQLDLQMMRSNKLGYNAPIVVYDKKYYKYEDESYTITDIPITENDINVLSETLDMLKQFKDFSLFSELGGIIQKLEDKVYSEKGDRQEVIHLERNEKLKGLEFLDVLYQAILKKIVLNITYKSFKAIEYSLITMHPYILKEFNNRWFIVGKSEKTSKILTLALDRILEIDYDFTADYNCTNFNGDEYYKNTIGVTVLGKKQLHEVVLKIDKSNAPYVLTKPFHHSQELLKTNEDDSVLIKIKVHFNFELERLILGFGSSIEVLKPRVLRNRIQNNLQNALKKYKK